MNADLSLTYPVQLSVRRDVLNHTWLENGIIFKRVEGILDLWLDGSWQALNNEFLSREKDAELFGELFLDAFSPANFVELLGPLSALPQDTQEKLRQALDSLYRSDGKMVQLQDDYLTALKHLRKSLSDLREVWHLPKPDGIESMRKSATQLIEAASALNAVMGRIPKGVVIP